MMIRTALFQVETYWRAGMPFHEAIRQVLANALTADAQQSAARMAATSSAAPAGAAEHPGQNRTAVDVSAPDFPRRESGATLQKENQRTPGVSDGYRSLSQGSAKSDSVAKGAGRPACTPGTEFMPSTKRLKPVDLDAGTNGGPAQTNGRKPRGEKWLENRYRPDGSTEARADEGNLGGRTRPQCHSSHAADLEEGAGPVYIRPARFGRQ